MGIFEKNETDRKMFRTRKINVLSSRRHTAKIYFYKYFMLTNTFEKITWL